MSLPEQRRAWKEVNGNNPCPACKHTSWCRVSDDGDYCACRRSEAGGQHRTDKNGEDYWLHRLTPSTNCEKWPEPQYSPRDCPKDEAGNPIPADPDLKHKVYSRFGACLPLRRVHVEDLERRSIKDKQKEAGYRTLGRERAEAVLQLIKAGMEKDLVSIPGFYVAEKEGRRYWSVAGMGGLLIPIRDIQGRIIAYSVRLDSTPEDGGKYRYLSSKKHGGVGPGAPIHVPRFNGDKTLVRVTEGALKADVATRLSGILTIGLPGVNSWRRGGNVLKEIGAKIIRVAFDADARRNLKVARCLSHLIGHLRGKGFTVELELWKEEDGKGIDDLLNAGKTPDVLRGAAAIDAAVAEIMTDAEKADPAPNGGQNGQAKESYGGYPLTDLGNAERLRERHGQDLRHCHPWKQWLRWKKRYWAQDQTGAITAAAVETVRSIYAEAANAQDDKLRGALRDHAKTSESAKSIRAMIDLARSQPGIPILHTEMDSDPWLFNVRNGTLDLRTGKLRDHQRSDLITKICPINYLSNAPCPTWERFLNTIFPNDDDEPDIELIVFMQRLLGRCLTGDVTEQNLPIFWGGGANGKSTLVNAVLKTIGTDYAMKADAALLMSSNKDRHPTEKADLFGMRLVVASESEQGKHLNESLIKDLTGGEPVRARRMKENFWEFDPTHKIVLLTNHKPRVTGTDEGIWRRLRLIPFGVCFWDPADPHKDSSQLPSNLRADKQLFGKLLAEREGILAWLVRGCMDWQREGLILPSKVLAETKKYRAEEDVLARWIEEACITGSTDYRQRSQQLFDAYKEWSERAGEKFLSQKLFGPTLEERGYQKHVSDGVWYLGIALRK